ncbi:nucleotide sugar dehydrogenase [Motiliproteus sediminis]|uniref:nucleotide sugar dehydrogenase n=1 Tax=Motiliproteus sediminis TaxID=1468178 RepID=UPI001AF00063|nr:nucleotide sugar dehydrogenase [Motiliproteus sediminis]
MRISIFGLGYVGAVSLACLGRDGHEVIGVDIDPTKLELIRSGRSPIIEAGMPELMANVVASGRIIVTDDVAEAINQTDISFVCVGTPSQTNGDQDQRAVLRLTEQLGKAIASKGTPHTIVFRSTLIPGTVEKTLIPMLEQITDSTQGEHFDVCFQPEFLREGSSIKDYDQPPFTIIGGSSERAFSQLQALFDHLPCEFHRTDIATAETLKYFCNIFHAVKITFANEVARLCEALSVDPHQVMALLCQDRQLNISPAYMKPGYAFGGSCLPKDLRAMQFQAKQRDVIIPMLSHVLHSNEVHLNRALDKIRDWRNDHGLRRVAQVGLSFKSGTDDLRESPLVELAEQLIGKGMELEIFDPEVNLSNLIGANKRFIEESIPHIGRLMRNDLGAMLANADIVIVGLGDKELLDIVRQQIRPDQILLDLVNMPDRGQLNCNYHGLAW